MWHAISWYVSIYTLCFLCIKCAAELVSDSTVLAECLSTSGGQFLVLHIGGYIRGALGACGESARKCVLAEGTEMSVNIFENKNLLILRKVFIAT